jgi:hypothetical protein
MNVPRKAFDGILWLTPIHRWTTVVTIAFVAGAFLWVLLVSTGLTDIAKSPNDVVLEVYRAAQDGRAEEVRNYLAEDAKAAFDNLPAEERNALLARLSQGHTTSQVEVLGVRNYGSHAVVGISQDYGVNGSAVRVEVAKKEGRYWRLEWPLGEAKWEESNRRFDPYYRSGGGI